MSGFGQTPRLDDPVEPGQLLADRFRVVRRIAHGGMGIVYEGFDEKLGRRIALKCARGGHGHHLSPEVRLATEISHPNVCKIYEIHTALTPQGPLEFFTMELLEGHSLAQRLQQGPVPRVEARTIARQICAGLAEAHRHGVIHGDLKSANIILARNPDGSLRAVITDFGLAHGAMSGGSDSSFTSARGTGGTPGYMAPELRAGGPNSVASDIYALGVILHELACGFRPDQRAVEYLSTLTQPPSSTSATDGGNPEDAPREPKRIPPLHSGWDTVIKTCLRNDPGERYQSATRFSKRLARRR